jgi:hypothetical protein
MGKRSSGTFEREQRDLYRSPLKAALPLIPFLRRDGINTFAEPCVGEGDLKQHLESHGFLCTCEGDISTGQDALACRDFGPVDAIVTNPPFSRWVEMAEHFQKIATTWLLGELDWTANKYFARFLNSTCSDIVHIGRVRWIRGTKHNGKQNFVWYRLDARHVGGTVIHPRGSDGTGTNIDQRLAGAELIRRQNAFLERFGEAAYLEMIQWKTCHRYRTEAVRPALQPKPRRAATPAQADLFREENRP